MSWFDKIAAEYKVPEDLVPEVYRRECYAVLFCTFGHPTCLRIIDCLTDSRDPEEPRIKKYVLLRCLDCEKKRQLRPLKPFWTPQAQAIHRLGGGLAWAEHVWEEHKRGKKKKKVAHRRDSVAAEVAGSDEFEDPRCVQEQALPAVG